MYIFFRKRIIRRLTVQREAAYDIKVPDFSAPTGMFLSIFFCSTYNKTYTIMYFFIPLTVTYVSGELSKQCHLRTRFLERLDEIGRVRIYHIFWKFISGSERFPIMNLLKPVFQNAIHRLYLHMTHTSKSRMDIDGFRYTGTITQQTIKRPE